MKHMITLSRREFLSSTSLLAAQSQSPASTPTIGDAPQLFVDLDFVASLENVRQVFHSAEKHPDNPVLRKEKPWELDREVWLAAENADALLLEPTGESFTEHRFKDLRWSVKEGRIAMMPGPTSVSRHL